MNLSAENAFIGATVSKGVETLTVYKVNVKSFYAGKYPLDEFKSMLSRLSGLKLSWYCLKSKIEFLLIISSASF